jgi:hypothetical protein
MLDVSSGKLTWELDDVRSEFPVPLWASPAVEFMVKASRSWSIAVLHDLVSNDDAPFLELLVKRLMDAGFLEETATVSGGVGRVPEKHVDEI